MNQQPVIKTASWNSHTQFMGLDWAKNHHEIPVVDRDGRIVVGVAVYQLPSYFTIRKDNSELCYALKKPLAEGKFVS